MSASVDINPVLLWVILGFLLFLFITHLFRKTFKRINVPAVCLVTGAPKTGKSLFCVNHSEHNYIGRWLKWWFCAKILRKKDLEEPLYYTNGYVTFGWFFGKLLKLDKNICYITEDLLYRNERFAYGSVIYIQECSLLADNMDVKNVYRNVDLSLLNKLIGHMTKGGVLYYDTQSVLDAHYSIKRVASTFLFITKSVNFLLFRVLFVRECVSQELGMNTYDSDVDNSMKLVLVPFWYYKRYNCYEYSFLTDSLPVSKVKANFEDKKLLSFNPIYIERADKREKGNN